MDNLETITEDGQIPESRIKDAQSAYQIWNAIKMADASSSMSRAAIDAAYDNEPPLDEDKLKSNGQDYRVNVSWGFMDMVLDTAMAGYVDIYAAVESIFSCPTLAGTEVEREELENVVAREVSDGIRAWPDFYWNYLRLCSTFIKHGVAIALMDDESDWRWTATDLSDFKLPRKTRVGQENITVAGCLRFYSATDLFRMIADPQLATDLGYNVEAIKHTIQETVRNGSAFNNYANTDWEHMQAELRNNDAFFSGAAAENELARVVHMFVKEFDGRITHLMIDDRRDNPQFLYRKVGRFDNIYQAFVLFCYGVGTNGYYHGIRGQGYKVFKPNGALNLAACQMLEQATYGSAVTIQPQDENALQEMQFLPTGPFNIITPGVKVLENAVIPNASQGSLAVLNTFSQMFRDRTSSYNIEGVMNASGGPEKTRAQVLSENAAGNKLNISQVNLFYVPYEILVREMVRRFTRRDYPENAPGGKYVADVVKRLHILGQEGEGPKDRYIQAFYSLDVDRLQVTKAIGSGSETARMATFDRLFQMYGTYPDSGKEALVWDITSAVVGAKNSARYATRPGRNSTPMVDVTIAGLENQILTMGGQIEVVDGQNDFAHAKEHFKYVSPMLDECQKAMGLNDIQKLSDLLPKLNVINTHLAQHVDRLSKDPLVKQESAQMRQMMQQSDEIIHNGLLKVDKAQKQAQKEQMLQQTGPPGAPGQGGPPPAQMDPVMMGKIEGDRIAREQALHHADEEHKAKMQIRAQEAAQKMAIEDAKAKQDIMGQQAAQDQKLKAEMVKAIGGAKGRV